MSLLFETFADMDVGIELQGWIHAYFKKQRQAIARLHGNKPQSRNEPEQ